MLSEVGRWARQSVSCRWDVATSRVRVTVYDKSVGVMDQTIGEPGREKADSITLHLQQWA